MKGGETVVDLIHHHETIEIEQVARALSHPDSNVESIDLRRNGIDDTGAIALAGALKINTTLKKLNLRWNKIDNEGAIALAGALKTNMTLTTLELTFNRIDDEGASALASALKTNTTLTTLDLGENEIGKNDGAIALAAALTANTTLTKLDLTCNQIDDEGAIALADALKTNATLTTLDLDQNEIDGYVGVEDTIRLLLEKNQHEARLDPLISAVVHSSGSISELVDVLLENERHIEPSLSIAFDLLRVRVDWATSIPASATL